MVSFFAVLEAVYRLKGLMFAIDGSGGSVETILYDISIQVLTSEAYFRIMD